MRRRSWGWPRAEQGRAWTSCLRDRCLPAHAPPLAAGHKVGVPPDFATPAGPALAVPALAVPRSRSLLVVLDHLGRADARVLGVEAGGTPGLALAEQVVALVELDPDPIQAPLIGILQPAAVARAAPERLLLRSEVVDLLEDRVIVHRDAPGDGVPAPRRLALGRSDAVPELYARGADRPPGAPWTQA